MEFEALEMSGTIDHIGIATKNLDAHTEFWKVLGLNQGKDEINEEQGVRIRFFDSGENDAKIELLEPTAQDTPIGRFISSRGEGVQQIAIRVDDIESTIDNLIEIGVQMIGREVKIGSSGSKIAFIHPKSTGGVLVELVQRVNKKE